MRNIVCVLKTGGWMNGGHNVEYRPEHVQRLANEVYREMYGEPYQFICMSDVSVPGVQTIPLQDNLPGWWSKIELFRAFEQAFFLDLDTTLCGDLRKLVNYPHRFTVLRNLTALSSTTNTKRIGSGVMAWEGDYSKIYRTFMRHPQVHMDDCRTSEKWGDQGFIQSMGFPMDRWQDLFPGAVRSYKYDSRDGMMPKGTVVCCYHGQPKPWDAPVQGFF